MNFYFWLMAGLAGCLAAVWSIARSIKRSNESLRNSRRRLEVERLADENRALREASDRELHRQRIAAQQAARVDSRRRAEAQAQTEAPPAAPKPERLLPPIVAKTVERFAVEPVEGSVIAPPVAEPDVAADALAQPLVMIADDSKVVRVKTGRLLAPHPYRVCFASDGIEAWRAIQADRPAVLITDVDMPGLDGFELTRRLRADPATARMPVIMITAADATHRAAAAEAGVDVVLGKPFDEAELLCHVQAAVRRPGTAPETSMPRSAAERTSSLATAN